jgi:uncharacterized membrane protein YdbT with pleckstrin-like domain
MEDEPVIWKGSPSQLTNLGTFLMAGLVGAGAIVGGLFFPPAFALMLISIVWAGWIYLKVRCRIFELTSQRLRLLEGVLSRRLDEVELYRVKDTAIEQSFWLRMFGLATVIVETSDRSHPNIRIEAIPDGLDVREKLRANVERLRDQKRVREVDFESGEDGDFDGDMDMN